MASAQGADDATRSAARTLGYSGVEAYQAGDYVTASERLEKAYRVLQVPSLALWSARALTKLGRLVEAAERYRDALRLSPEGGDVDVQKRAQTEATSELETLKPRVPVLIIELTGAEPREVSLVIDGLRSTPELIGEARPTNPGQHRVVLRRGSEEMVREVSLTEGQQETVTFDFADQPAPATPPVKELGKASPAPAEPPSNGATQRTVGWVTLGIGGASLAASGIVTAIALGKKSDLGCEENRCSPADRDEVDGYNSLRTVSTVTFFAGVALGATGVVLLVSAPSGNGTEVALALGPGSVRLNGSF
jgi:hypothetical protein